MATILFFSRACPDVCLIAEGIARSLARDAAEVLSATDGPEAVPSAAAVEVMAEAGVDISAQRARCADDIRFRDIDVIVRLSANGAVPERPVLPGEPTPIHWNVIPPSIASGTAPASAAVLRPCRDEIGPLISQLFERGYLEAVLSARAMSHAVLDQLSEGIIAHDASGRITCFNRAAERITGLSRNEVMGRECRDFFEGGLCKGHCALYGRDVPAGPEPLTHIVEIPAPSGETRLVEMTVHRTFSRKGEILGVVASLRDFTREHAMARRLGEMENFSGIVGRDAKMLAVFDLIRNVADADVPVLVQGESGTGKELAAAAIHNESRRADKLFVPVNCGALPESLLESELFGHVRGAFTGAIRDKKGRFELADGGTIFLDEIGDVAPAVQVKLLRVLQEGVFERVGSSQPVKVSVRVISATNKDLKKEIAAGRFREDLYYRLCVVPIVMPPLRERRGDIPLLVAEILLRYAPPEKRGTLRVSPAAMDALLARDWPGNVRELQNALQYALIKVQGSVIELADLPPYIPGGSPPAGRKAERRRRFKLDVESVRRALKDAKGNRSEAARRLGVGRATLYRFLDLVGDLGV